MIYLGILDKDYKITVDIQSGNISSGNIIFASTDQNISNIKIHFEKEGNPIDITGFTFIANIQKPDTLQVPFQISILDAVNGIAQMDLPISLTFDIGEYLVEIEMSKDGEVSHTNTFKYTVRDTLCGDIDETIIDDPNYNLLINLVEDVNQLETVVTANEKLRVATELKRIEDEELREQSETQRQTNEVDREERINTLIASGTVDLETRDARTDVKGVVHENLRECMIANYNYLNLGLDIMYETVEG